MAKTIKVLSDGTVAKVGMIIRHSCCNDITITRISKLIHPCDFITIYKYSFWDNNYNWITTTNTLCKATPEERKLYYQRIYAEHK